MMINSVSNGGSGIPAGTGMNTQEDVVSKSIKKQIENAREQLQEVSSNEDLSMEEKMKKRQEIQKEITMLNQQLRQHQIELRREKQEEQTVQASQSRQTQQTTEGSGLSRAGMQTMLSADSSLKQAKVQGSVSARMEGQAGVLKAEINQDKGKNTQAKEAELAEIEKRAANTTASQMDTLSDANQALQETKTAGTDTRKEKEVSETDGRKDRRNEDNLQKTDEVPEKQTDAKTIGTNVDVRL